MKHVASNISYLESKGISLVSSPSLDKAKELLEYVNRELTSSYGEAEKAYLSALKDMCIYYVNEFDGQDSPEPTYTLRLIKNSYTLDEAKAEIDKKQSESSTVFRG